MYSKRQISSKTQPIINFEKFKKSSKQKCILHFENKNKPMMYFEMFKTFIDFENEFKTSNIKILPKIKFKIFSRK